jgi:hypothetical protein
MVAVTSEQKTARLETAIKICEQAMKNGHGVMMVDAEGKELRTVTFEADAVKYLLDILRGE